MGLPLALLWIPVGWLMAADPRPLPPLEFRDFEVIIVGGSTAALSAALAAADQGAKTALLEPTDWVGGQLTSSGVPAVDECWHTIKDPASGKELFSAAALARDPRNMTPEFRDLLDRMGNPGRGWVSRFCFEPSQLIARELWPLVQRRHERLTIFFQTVPKEVEVVSGGRRIHGIQSIRRIADETLPWHGYDRLPSDDLDDWYSREPSSRFNKQLLHFKGNDRTVFIDASEWGELLVLAKAPYLQGVENAEGGRESLDQLGQCITFGLVEEYLAEPRGEEVTDHVERGLGWGQYREKPDAWQQVWTYRRIRSTREEPSAGDLCLQNWGYFPVINEGGNDYPFGYLFLAREKARAQTQDWRGGVNLGVLRGAERRALAWHAWYKSQAPADITPDRIVLAKGVLGTGHGLSKLPYIRDTRRSIGLDGFVLRMADLTGPPTNKTAPAMVDRIAIGCYDADIHAMTPEGYPEYIHEPRTVLPFHIPFRALTSDAYDNLLVAGKTMAQSFLANSATRLHPIEWSTGIAAGTAAAHMHQTGKTSRRVLETIDELQPLIRARTPIDWTID